MKKRLLWLAIAAFCFASVGCNDDSDEPINIEINNPNPTNPSNPSTPSTTTKLPNFLKECIDRTKHPIFKFSGAIEAWDFNSDKSLRDTVSAHFDEIVAGNSMKYSGCVDGNGNMNFSTVKDFCANAKACGLTIYGHTLAWHSQQQPKYLNSLLYKEVAVEQDPGVVETETSLLKVDFTTFKGTQGHVISEQEGTVHDGYGNEYSKDDKVDYPYYAMGYVPTMTDEGLESKSDSWYQYFVMSKIAVETDVMNDYRLKVSVKSEGDISFNGVARWSWDDGCYKDVQITFNKSNDFKDYVFDFNGIAGNGFEIIFQPPAGTTFVIKNLEICKVDGKAKTNLVSLSAEEKRDALVGAMDRWIAGIMEATDGFVKGWDVVNEAIAGGGNDGEGNYTL